MSTEEPEPSGRWRQKQRTRDALIEAARELVANGLAPTVEMTAQHAGISRTTAYRYFPKQRDLLLAAHPEIGRTSLLDLDAPRDPETRLEQVITTFTQLISDTEAQQRTMLRLSLELSEVERAALPLRQGRAIGWIAEALEPLEGRLTDHQRQRLVLAIRSSTGIESLIWLSDVAKLPRADALALMRWSAKALLHAALDDLPPPSPKRRPQVRR